MLPGCEIPPDDANLSLEQCVTLACLMDVTTPKPGNVHRGADFHDMTFFDFVCSAIAIGPVMACSSQQRLGQTVLKSIQATRRVTSANTNLGIVLLLAPLAACAKIGSGPSGLPQLKQAVRSLLDDLVPADSADVYEAIRLAKPGGLGASDKMDVRDEAAPTDLMEAMAYAADRDQIAREYVTGFSFIVDAIAPRLCDRCGELGPISAVLDTYLWVLAEQPDSLIRRKCGDATATQASQLAAKTLSSGTPGSETYHEALADFDFWLRSDGNRRNPGTTADLVTAGVFVGLAQGMLKLRELPQ